MLVFGLLILATILYTLFDLFVAKAGGKLNDNLAAVVFNSIGALIPLVIYLAVKAKSETPTTKTGIIYSCLAGIAIALFSIVLVNLFSRAQNVTYVLPFIYGGTVVLGSLAGVFVFKERLSTTAIAGIVLTTVGLSLLVYSKISA